MEAEMEKKGDILNQLAIISDLLDKINLEGESKTLVIELKEPEFLRVFNYINGKNTRMAPKPDKTFTIELGGVNTVFNKSNV